MTDIISNVPEFVAGEKPTPQKMNALRTALLALFAGGIPSDSLSWPVIAQGPLDMNGNDIININSTSGEIRVNSTRTIAQAVSTVNAQGYGTIIIDSGFSAVAPSAGLEITANNVRLTGGGQESELVLGNAAAYGLRVSGANFHMADLELTTTSGGIYTSAVVLAGAHPTISNIRSSGAHVHLIQIGEAATLCRDAHISNVYASGNVGAVIEIVRAEGYTLESISALTYTGSLIHFPATCVSAGHGNIVAPMASSAGAGDGIVSEVAAPASTMQSIHVLGGSINTPNGVAFSLAGTYFSTAADMYLNGEVFIDQVLQMKMHNCVLAGSLQLGTSTLSNISECDINGDVDIITGTRIRNALLNNRITGDVEAASGTAWSQVIGNRIGGNSFYISYAEQWGLNAVTGVEY